MSRPTRFDRRAFTQGLLASAASACALRPAPSEAAGALQSPSFAAIGIGGKGVADLKGAVAAGFRLAALVDVVDARKAGGGPLPRNAGKMQAEFPDVPFFSDYREMLARMGDKVDAVTVSTPDHHHFHASLLAMRAGKHVFCQKPLTHGVWESRALSQAAAKSDVKTQMGNQAHALDGMRRCVELVRGGAIGKVREVHGWTNRPIWPQGMAQRPPEEKVPAWMDWEQWIGPAPFAGYSPKIAPFAWRGMWDYGCGALGDMACHILDLGWWAVEPGAPRSVVAEQKGGTEFSPPISSKITWTFGPSPYSVPEGCTFHWYDGYLNARFDAERWAFVKESEEYRHPDAATLGGEDFRKVDTAIVGEYGTLFFARENPNWVLKAASKIDGFRWPAPSLPRAGRQDVYQEWFDAVTGKIARGLSDFSVAGPFTEMVLLGTLAQRLPGKVLEWDAARMEVKGAPETRSWIRRAYRPGWEIEA